MNPVIFNQLLRENKNITENMLALATTGIGANTFWKPQDTTEALSILAGTLLANANRLKDAL